MIITVVYMSILAVLSMYGFHRLMVLWLYWKNRKNAPVADETGEAYFPIVTVQLPVYNEFNVIERLIDAACKMDWPKDRMQIQVLDDSTDDTTVRARRAAARWQARGVDIEVIHRTDRTGYKAGALEKGTEVARGEFLAVFDADFVPQSSFLREVMPYFANRPNTGMVQARWGHINESDSLLTRLSTILLDGHFVLEHTARNRSGRFFNFNGTAGIWRRSCIEDAGGWEHDTITEDLDLSYRAQLKGWQFVFLKDLVVPAEVPADMRAFKLQQHRWAKGTIQTARKLLWRILTAPIPLKVKSEAWVHMTSNLAYPLVLALAVLMPISIHVRAHLRLSDMLWLDLIAFVLATLSVGIFYTFAEKEAHGSWLDRIWRIPLVMALGIGIAVNQSKAVFDGLFGNDITFRRTPKLGENVEAGTDNKSYTINLDWTPIVELLMTAYYLTAVCWAMYWGYWKSIPFMLLFGCGFAYVALSSVLRRPPIRPEEARSLSRRPVASS